jgi:zinc protease
MARKAITIAAAAVIAAALPALGQVAPKQTPPAPGPIRPFEFPKYETKKLANGLTVFVIEDHRMPVVSYRMEITSAGAKANDPKHAGLADMTGSLLRQGTKTRSAQQIASTLDRVGANLGTGAGSDTATVNGTATKSAAPLLLEVMADVVQNPAFSQDEVDRIKRQALSGLQVAYNDPQTLAGYLATRVAYGDHAYGMPVDGTPDTLKALTRDDIAGFYATHYGPATSYLAIAGDVTAAEAFAAAEKHFGGWKADVKAAKIDSPRAGSKRQVVLIDKPDAVQTQFRLVSLAIPRNHPDYIPLLVANQIFGGSFNSRLNMKLRAAEGLTYGAGSNFGTLVQGGTFSMSSFTRTEKTGTAIKMMTDLAQELIDKPITDQELNEAKAYLAGSFVISIETADAVAACVLTSAVNGLPADYCNRYREAIQSTTKEQVVEAVKKHVSPDKLNVIAVGNAAQFSKELEGYGQPQTIPIADFDLTQPNYMRAKEAVAVTGESKARGLELIKQAVEATGGKAALEGVKAIRAKGGMTLTMGQQSMKADVDEVVVFPDKYRMNMTLPMGQMVQGYDGKTAWMQQGPATREMPPDAAKEMGKAVERSAGIQPLLAALDGSATVSAIEPATVEGKTLPGVLWTRGDSSMKMYFDPESKRVAKLAYRGLGMAGPADIEVVLGDYRKIGDLYLPYQATVLQNGEKFADRSITEYVLNENVDAGVFAKPAA